MSVVREVRDSSTFSGGGGGRHRLTLAVLVLLAAAAAGCDDGGSSAAPLSPNGIGRIEAAAVPAMTQESGAFYWYRDTKIFLDPVPGEFVIRAREDAEPAAAAREALAELQAGVSEKRVAALGHRVLEVTGGGPPEEVADRLRQHPRITFASPVYTDRAEGGEIVPLNTLVVKFQDGASRGEIDELNALMGTRVVREPVQANGWRYHILGYPESGTDSPLEIAAAYDRHALTEWADPNKTRPIVPAGGENEPHFAEQWYLDDNTFSQGGVPADIAVTGAWATSVGVGVTVAMLDTGVDGTHEDLDNLVNGGTAPSLRCNNGETSSLVPVPEDSHGTSVAGIIAADHNLTGVAGVAPKVTLVSFRHLIVDADCSFADPENDTEAPPDQEIADLLGLAWNQFGADVISNSWSGGSPSNAIADAIKWAVKDGRDFLGTPVVFSAGNSGGSIAFPSNLDEVITVSGLLRNGELHPNSSRGPEVDIAAFSGGSDFSTPPCNGQIVTTDLQGPGGCDDGPGGNVNYTDGFGGTSAAAPQVSGAIALLLSAEPGLTEPEVRQRLADSADRGFWNDPNQFGAGKLNADALVNGPFTATIVGPYEPQVGFPASWDASIAGGHPPYGGYAWYKSGALVSTGTSYSESSVGAAPFELKLVAQDSWQPANTDSMTIWVEPFDPNSCPDQQFIC